MQLRAAEICPMSCLDGCRGVGGADLETDVGEVPRGSAPSPGGLVQGDPLSLPLHLHLPHNRGAALGGLGTQVPGDPLSFQGNGNCPSTNTDGSLWDAGGRGGLEASPPGPSLQEAADLPSGEALPPAQVPGSKGSSSCGRQGDQDSTGAHVGSPLASAGSRRFLANPALGQVRRLLLNHI